jgi:hypothetical protein
MVTVDTGAGAVGGCEAWPQLTDSIADIRRSDDET